MTADATPETDPETAAAIDHVRGLFPPLPDAYGHWLVHLAELAKNGTSPDTMVPVPEEIVERGPLPHQAKQLDEPGTWGLTLGQALSALRQDDLLWPEEAEAAGIEVVTPLVALALANTATAATVAEEHCPGVVEELAEELASGRWTVYAEQPVRVDEHGRLVYGIDRLLAIVAADMPAPVAITYAYDAAPRPLTWQPPTREA